MRVELRMVVLPLTPLEVFSVKALLPVMYWNGSLDWHIMAAYSTGVLRAAG